MMLELYMNKRDQRDRWRAEMKPVSRDKKADTGHWWLLSLRAALIISSPWVISSNFLHPRTNRSKLTLNSPQTGMSYSRGHGDQNDVLSGNVEMSLNQLCDCDCNVLMGFIRPQEGWWWIHKMSTDKLFHLWFIITFPQVWVPILCTNSQTTFYFQQV